MHPIPGTVDHIIKIFGTQVKSGYLQVNINIGTFFIGPLQHFFNKYCFPSS